MSQQLQQLPSTSANRPYIEQDPSLIANAKFDHLKVLDQLEEHCKTMDLSAKERKEIVNSLSFLYNYAEDKFHMELDVLSKPDSSWIDLEWYRERSESLSSETSSMTPPPRASDADHSSGSELGSSSSDTKRFFLDCVIYTMTHLMDPKNVKCKQNEKWISWPLFRKLVLSTFCGVALIPVRTYNIWIETYVEAEEDQIVTFEQLLAYQAKIKVLEGEIKETLRIREEAARRRDLRLRAERRAERQREEAIRQEEEEEVRDREDRC